MVSDPGAEGRGPGQPLVIGHRGASAVEQENTVAAFKRAAALGADWVELDVRRTADATLAIHHDAHLPDGRPLVGLRTDDLPTTMADLAGALDACAGMGVNVEIKNSPPDPDFDPDDRLAVVVADLLLARIGPGGPFRPDQILVTSFNPATIAAVRDRAPSLPTGLLVADLSDPAAVVALAAGGGHVAVNPWDPMVDEGFVQRAHAAGLAVNVWTVDDPARMAVLLAIGVDGIITNVPDVARAVVDATL